MENRHLAKKDAEKVFFSVICPVFNSKMFLEKTLDCLNNQTYENFEVIFIDDCSTDNSLEELKNRSKMSGLNIKIIENKRNLGAGASRNEGLLASKGEWLAFLDSDDFWAKDKLLKCKDIIDNNLAINLVTHDEFKIKDGIVVGNLNYSKKNKRYPFTPRRLYWTNYFSTSAIVLKKSLIKSHLFQTSLRSCQDYEFWLRLSKNLKPYFISDKLGYYRVHKNNITSGPILNRLINELRVAYLYRPVFGLSLFLMKCVRIKASFIFNMGKVWLN